MDLRVAASVYRETGYFYAHILRGQIDAVKPADQGQIAIVDGVTLAVYESVGRAVNCYVFRGAGDVLVPGLAPGANVLCHALGRVQRRRLLTTLDWLDQHAGGADRFDDLFWLRLHAVVNRRDYGVRHLKRLVDATV